MSAKHTPGPWVVETEALLSGHVMTCEGYAIADCVLDYSSIGIENQKANARLIAAAPSMAAALKAMLNAFHEDPTASGHVREDAISAAYAALEEGGV